MNFATYKIRIASEIEPLSVMEKVAICLVCCRRLAPLYTEFVRIEKWGDESPFCQCREESIKVLSGQCDSMSITTDVLDLLIPDTEDFGTFHGSFALNAGLSHLGLINQVNSTDSSPTIDALLMCYSTIDFCVQQALDPECSRSVPLSDIDAHPMMIQEIQFQLASIDRVRGCSELVQFANIDSKESELSSFMLSTIAANGG